MKSDNVPIPAMLRARPRVPTLIAALAFAWIACASPVGAQSLTRSEALKIAESFVHFHWQATVKNMRHGTDANGIEIQTPDRDSGHGNPLSDCWRVDSENVGVAYKWGGFDTPQSFEKGVRAGKAAGDVYTGEKRRKGGAAVSGDAVGIDCSGFISRCWKLDPKHSTSMLAASCQKLTSPADLQPADIMNTAEGHVLLFVKWLDPEKDRALFYESAPFSKTRATERKIADLAADGYAPLRYRRIRD